jgi:hypothetical protein
MSNSFENLTQPMSGPGPGRPTITDEWLDVKRERLVSMLSSHWPAIGWQLTTADSREKLWRALQPVKDHPDSGVFSRLLHPTTVEADAFTIRRKRLMVEDASKNRFYAQKQCDKRIEACREIETATAQATPDQMEYVQREFTCRRAECQNARQHLHNAKLCERDLENELADAEAAYSQDELLEFIKKRKYALHPLNLANAIAGLPFARDLSFVGVWVSRERCAKIESDHWPHIHYELFKRIESIWNDRGPSNTSAVEVFREKIAALPKTVKPTIPQQKQTKKKRVPNLIRQQLGENFFYLEQAIDKSLKCAGTDPRPMPFLILEKFDEFLAKPRTAVDQVLATARKIT